MPATLAGTAKQQADILPADQGHVFWDFCGLCASVWYWVAMYLLEIKPQNLTFAYFGMGGAEGH